MVNQLVFGLGLGLTSVLASLGGFLILTGLQMRRAPPPTSIFADHPLATVFLFDGDTLVDATPAARALIAASPAGCGPWSRLMAYLAPRFPGIEARLATLDVSGQLTLAADDDAPGPLILRAELGGGLLRLTLIDPDTETRAAAPDSLTQKAIGAELDLLRRTVTQSPIMIWRERDDGAVIWANAPYLMKAAEVMAPGEELGWPLKRLFDRTATTQGATGQRHRMQGPSDKAGWFELIGYPDGDSTLVHAIPVDAAVQAETALREFMQTLTKTFAHLPIGLAIFDQNRQLQLFNPALIDLTGLAPDFLSMRPSLFAVLDAMRDGNMIPEPKDYRSWRRDIAELEKAAASGLYEDTWSLPGGQTYRVIGRPHPNGALALIFEDISTEMSRTRRYRADLETGQSVIDEIDDAIAVFSQAGQLIMSNAAYVALWQHDPGAVVGDGGIARLADYWRAHSAPTPLWAAAEEFVATYGERQPWQGEARLTDGRLIACRVAPVSGGATMVTFRVIAPADAVQPELTLATARRSA